jgi:hypothetical protein
VFLLLQWILFTHAGDVQRLTVRHLPVSIGKDIFGELENIRYNGNIEEQHLQVDETIDVRIVTHRQQPADENDAYGEQLFTETETGVRF